jgi:NitT/TauT family transport system substrate-binding protein
MNTTRRRLLTNSSAMGMALVLPGIARAQKVLSVTYGPATAVYAVTAVALEKGFLQGEGLNAKIVPADAGARARQVMAAGDAMFLHNDASQPLFLANRGRKAKMILGTQMVCAFANVVVRKDLFDAGINSIEALGNYKRPGGAKPIIAATAIGSGTWMFGTKIFENKQLGNQMNWVNGGGAKTMLAGLQSKQFDAIMATPAWLMEAEAMGFGKAIYDTRNKEAFTKEFGGTLPVLVVSALAETLDKEPALAQAYVTGMLRAMKWMKSASADEIYALVGNKYFAGNPESTKLELTYDRDTWAFDGQISKADYERGAAVWFRPSTEIKPASYEEMVDMRFVNAAKVA